MNQPPNSYYQAGFGYGAPGQGQTWPGPGQKVNQPPRGPSGNSPYGPPKAMTGPYSSGAPGVQNQQIYSGQPGYMNMNSSQPNQAVQNGSLTPPSSMTGLPRNEPARQGPGGQLPHQIGQINKQLGGMQIQGPPEQKIPSSFPGMPPSGQSRPPMSSGKPPGSQPVRSPYMPSSTSSGSFNGPPAGLSSGPPSQSRFPGPPGGLPSGPPGGPTSGPPGGPPSGPPGGPPSGPPSGLPSGPPSGLPSGPPSGPPLGAPGGPPRDQAARGSGVAGGRRPYPSQPMSQPSQMGPSSSPMQYGGGNPMAPPTSVRPPMSNPSLSGPPFSSQNLAGPPIGSQAPSVSSGGGGVQGFPGQASPMPGQPISSQPMSQPNMSGPPMGQPSALHGRPGPMHGRPPMQGQMPGQMAGPAGPISSPMQGPSKRIDPDQMPSPIQVMSDDTDAFQNTVYQTSARGKLPPLVTTKCKIQDNGNASPRYIRSTMYNIPCNQDMLKESNIPMAMVITPFAKVPEDEIPLHLVDHGANGPVRCNRCKAYMNPFMQFIDGGRKFVCNICSHSSEVPAEYFCHLDHQGRRVDIYERPELCLGSYEFAATLDYCKDGKPPSAPAFIFMIDVSYQSMQCGMVRLLTKELHTLLDSLPKESGMEESLIRVGFVTYSSHLHFYNVKDNLAQPQMMVVSDVHDVFVPLLDGFLVSIKEARTVVDSLLDLIPELFHDTRETDVVLGPVIQAGMEALKAAGIAGKLLIFHSSLPIADAPGKLKNREDRKLLATDKEKTILAPQSNFYVNLAKDCVAGGVSVDLFLFPNAYVDVATIGLTVTQTGGQIYRYNYFKEATHGKQFIEDLKKNFSRDIGFDAIMRLRCSTGLRPVEFFGSFYMSNTTDVELASIDSDKAIAIELKHDDKIPEDGMAFAQCALLYTTKCGQRRLRIHNLAFNCCSQLADVYRCCELDTLMNFFTKSALRQVLSSAPTTIREGLIQRCSHILACYRQHCATPSTSGQLILPECMKLLPLYMGSLVKSDVLAGGSEMSSDDRAFLMQAALSMNTRATVPYLYPRLFELHTLDPEGEGLPVQMRCTADKMADGGIYLLENGISMFIWVGLQANPEILQQLFHANTIGQVDIEMTHLPELDSPLSKRVRGIIASIQDERQRYLKLTVVRQRDKLEPWFKHYLVEDKGFHSHHLSYVDFLCHIHKEIRNLLN